MKSIWFEDIVDVMLNIADPNTWAAVSEVPWVSSPKINAGVSVYNVEEWWTGIAWWSTNVSWSASDYDTVAWSSGSIYLPDWTALAVSSGNTGNMSWTTYIYYDRETNTVSSSTSASASVGENKILLCVASPVSWSWKKAEFQAFGTDDQSTFIYASNIAANTITGNEIYANSIDTAQLASWAVTAGKIDVSQLSAISANLWSITAWDITGTTVTAGKTSSWWIKLYPYSTNAWRIEFYYSGDMVWYMQWLSAWVWWAIVVEGDYFYLDTTVLCAGKLRIPVWNNLYN